MATPSQIETYITEEKKKKLLELGYDYDAMDEKEREEIWGTLPEETTAPLTTQAVREGVETGRVAKSRKESIKAGYDAEKTANKAVFLELYEANPKPYDEAVAWRTEIEMTGEEVLDKDFAKKLAELYGDAYAKKMDEKRQASHLVYPAGFDERAIQTAAEPQEVREKRKANVLPTSFTRELFELTQPKVSVGTFRGDKRTGVEQNRVAANAAADELIDSDPDKWSAESIEAMFVEIGKQLKNPDKFYKIGVRGAGGTSQPVSATSSGEMETSRVPMLTRDQQTLLSTYHRHFAIDNPEIVVPLVWWADPEETRKREEAGLFGMESEGTRHTLRDAFNTVTGLVSGTEPDVMKTRIYPGAVSYIDPTMLGMVETELGSTVETPITGTMRYLNLPENLFFGAVGQVLAEGAEEAGWEGWQEQRRTSAIQPTNVAGGDSFAEDIVISALANADGFRGGAEEVYDLVAAAQNTYFYRGLEDSLLEAAERVSNGEGDTWDSLLTTGASFVMNPFISSYDDERVERAIDPAKFMEEDLAKLRSRSRLTGWGGGFVLDLAASTIFWSAIGGIPGAVVGVGSAVGDTGKINKAMKVLLATQEVGSVAPKIKATQAANAVIAENYVGALTKLGVGGNGEDLRNVATKVLADGIETNRKAAGKTRAAETAVDAPTEWGIRSSATVEGGGREWSAPLMTERGGVSISFGDAPSVPLARLAPTDAEKAARKKFLDGLTDNERAVLEASDTANDLIDDILINPLTKSATPEQKQRWLQTLATNPNIAERLIKPSQNAGDAWKAVVGDAEGMRHLEKVIIQDEAAKAIAKITEANPVFSQGTILLTPRTMVGSQKKADEVIKVAEQTEVGKLITEINKEAVAGNLKVVGIVDESSGSLSHGIEVTPAMMERIKDSLRKLYAGQGEVADVAAPKTHKAAAEGGKTVDVPIHQPTKKSKLSRQEENQLTLDLNDVVDKHHAAVKAAKKRGATEEEIAKLNDALEETYKKLTAERRAAKPIETTGANVDTEAGRILAVIEGLEGTGKANVIPTIALRKMADMNIDSAARSVSPLTRAHLAAAGAPAALDILPQNMAPSRLRKRIVEWNKRATRARPEEISEMSVAAQTARKAMEDEISVLGDIVVRRVGHIKNRPEVKVAYGLEEGTQLTNTQAVTVLLGGTKTQPKSVRHDRVKLALDNIIDVLVAPMGKAQGEANLFGRFGWGADADINALTRIKGVINTDERADAFITALEKGTAEGADEAAAIIAKLYDDIAVAHKGEEEFVSLLTEEKLVDAVLAALVEGEKSIIVRKHLTELEDVVGVASNVAEGVGMMAYLAKRHGITSAAAEADWKKVGLNSPEAAYEAVYANVLANEIRDKLSKQTTDTIAEAVNAVFGGASKDAPGIVDRQVKLFRGAMEAQLDFSSKVDSAAKAIIKNNKLEKMNEGKGGIGEVNEMLQTLRSGKQQDRLRAIIGEDRVKVMEEVLGTGHDTSKIEKFAEKAHKRQQAGFWGKTGNWMGGAWKAFQAFRYNIILGYRSRFHGNNQATAAAINLQTLGAGATARSMRELDIAIEIVAKGSFAGRTKTTEALVAGSGWQEKIAVVSKDGKLYTYGDVFRLAEEGGGLRSQAGFHLSDDLMADIKNRTVNRDRGLINSTPEMNAHYQVIDPAATEAFMRAMKTGEWAEMPLVGGLFRQNVLSGLADDEDKVWRIANVIAELRRGGGENAAKTAGKRSLMDYGSLTELEKTHIQRVTLFWSFQSLSWRTFFKSAAEHPERMAFAVQFATNGIPFFTSPEEAKAQLSPYRADYLMPRPILSMVEGMDKENYYTVSPTIPILDKLVDIAPFVVPVVQKTGAYAAGVEGSRSHKEDLAHAFVSAFQNTLSAGFTPEIKMIVGKHDEMLGMIERGWIDPRDYYLLSNKAMDDGSTGWDAFTQLVGEPSWRPAREGETSWNGLVPFFEKEESIASYLTMKKSIGVVGAQTILYDYAPLMGEGENEELMTWGRRLTTSFPELFGLSTDVAKTDEFKARESAAKRKKAQEKTEITPK